MHTLTLNVKDTAYDNIIYFLKNLPHDVEIVSDKLNQNDFKKETDITSLRGVFNQYADPSKVHLEDKALEMHVVEKYKKENA